MNRLILTPAKTPGKFIARLDGEVICQSDQPMVDGARELIQRGLDPATPATMRHEGAAHDSFEPLALSAWAKWTYSETERDGLRRVPYRPRPEGAFPPTGSPKSDPPAEGDV